MSALLKTNPDVALPLGSADETKRPLPRYIARRAPAYAELTAATPAALRPARRTHAIDQETSTLREVTIRALDILGAIAGLILAAPIMLIVSILIMRDGGSALFSQIRVGQQGRGFHCFKLRSMASDAEARLHALLENNPQAAAEWAENRKLKDDPRITKLGHFIRKTSIDELPQLWNVLKGDMSLVGPRPIVPDELAMYGKDAAGYLSVRPGLTGLWQVSGRSDCDYETRVALDIEWTETRTVASYLEIVFKTVPAVLAKDGAY
ncbi:MAG: sugar transferase [Candidatus Phaeomarinobacter sp.]